MMSRCPLPAALFCCTVTRGAEGEVDGQCIPFPPLASCCFLVASPCAVALEQEEEEEKEEEGRAARARVPSSPAELHRGKEVTPLCAR